MHLENHTFSIQFATYFLHEPLDMPDSIPGLTTNMTPKKTTTSSGGNCISKMNYCSRNIQIYSTGKKTSKEKSYKSRYAHNQKYYADAISVPDATLKGKKKH